MNEEKLNELNKLYSLAESSNSTTNFYNRVYLYIDFIKNDKYLSDILEKDEVEYNSYQKEKFDTIPKKNKKESWFSYSKKEDLHLSDGDKLFLADYFITIEHHIYQWIHLLQIEDYKTPESDCMLNGEKNEMKEIYIKNFSKWKKYLEKFHTKLIQKIKETPVKESIFRLSKDGSFKYLNKAGAFSVSSREYKILNLLYMNKNEVVSYKEIIEKAFEKEDGKARRIALNTNIKNIKEKLNILPKKKTSQKDIIKNHRGAGYSLEIKDNISHSE